MAKYQLICTAYKGIPPNDYAADGGQHDSGEFETDDAAMQQFRSSALQLAITYDSLVCRVMEGDRLVRSWTLGLREGRTPSASPKLIAQDPGLSDWFDEMSEEKATLLRNVRAAKGTNA
jgi:hypothetical protein